MPECTKNFELKRVGIILQLHFPALHAIKMQSAPEKSTFSDVRGNRMAAQAHYF